MNIDSSEPMALPKRDRNKPISEQLHQSQKLEAVSQLAGGIAQDFNNLILVIQGNAELVLRNEKRLAERSRRSLKQVTEAAQRATDLIRQLLAFSRHQKIKVQPCDLNSLIVNLTKNVNPLIGEDILLRCQMGENLPWIQGDAGIIDQVLTNLIVNACDAMPHGGSLFITTEFVNIDAAYTKNNPEADVGKFVALTVRDTGNGIAPKHLRRIFEPYFTTKEIGRATGLGLAMVYGFIQQHQGWVDVSTQRGGGTAFKIYLPATETRHKGAFVRTGPGKPAKQERILLVDDDDAVRNFIRTVLEREGYQIQEASSGVEALKMWNPKTNNFDLLLTDIVMPGGIYGKELAERLQAKQPELKVIFMSGNNPYVEGTDPPRGYFLQKPFPVEVLTTVVRDYLASHPPG